jgi:hypothetical protein
MDNIIAVLERSDRVCRISLTNVSSSDLEEMQQPFPELLFLFLQSVSRSRFILGWIRPTSAIHRVV